MKMTSKILLRVGVQNDKASQKFETKLDVLKETTPTLNMIPNIVFAPFSGRNSVIKKLILEQ